MMAEIRGRRVPLQQTFPLTQNWRQEQELERVGGGAPEPLAERDPRSSLLTLTTLPSPLRRLLHDQGKMMRGGGGNMIMTKTRTRPYASRKTSFSERGTINGVMVGKDGTATVTTPSDSKDRPTYFRLPAKQASPYKYIEKPRQNMRTDTAEIKSVVFTLLYPEERAKSVATVPTVSEGEIRGRIPTLPATPKNTQSVRSSAGFHGGIKGVSENGGGGCYFSPHDPGESDG